MDKFCIFCGERPEEKTKEHVLPQWLLEMTGDPKRSLRLHFPYADKTTPPRDIAYDALHFPACSNCNNRFSELENNAKCVVEKLLQYVPLTAGEFDTFLAWLDKVRIGLWLGSLYLGGNPFSVSPKFHIEKRISTKDRAVIIYRVNDGRSGLHFQGTNTPMFHYLPCCFTLVINEFYFFNISADFLFARRLGLPYPQTALMRPDGLLEMQISSGLERVMQPLLRLPLSRQGTEVYQPIFLNEVFKEKASLYDTAYVRAMSMNWNKGTGWPMQIKGNVLERMPNEPSLDWLPKIIHSREELHLITIRQTLDIQADLWDYLYASLDKEFHRTMRNFQRINRAWSRFPASQINTLAESKPREIQMS